MSVCVNVCEWECVHAECGFLSGVRACPSLLAGLPAAAVLSEASGEKEEAGSWPRKVT